MKKILLSCLAVAACAGSALAADPTIYPDASFQQVSADGRYIVSYAAGSVVVYDLVEGTSEDYLQDENEGISYSIGHGNCFTADGSILAGTNSTDFAAAYLENGEWHKLNVLFEDFGNYPNGITRDGSRICGSVGLNPLSLEDKIMQVPAYWDRNADGNGYGECHLLPHPTKDLFGETPQYVTAIVIADDGKTIAGMMTFGNGSMNIPIIYTQDENGEWSYSLPTKDLFNPDGIEAVENPGDEFPTPPYYEDFMSEQEISDYYAALNDFFSGNPGSTSYPDAVDFMSEENKEKYEAAVEKFNEENAIFKEKFNEYQDYVTAVIESSPNFLFNNLYISTDNKYLVSSYEKIVPENEDDPYSYGPTSAYQPSTIDIKTGELKVIDSELSLTISGVADNGVILAHNGVGSAPMLGYVVKDGAVQTISEYISNINPDYGKWIEKNMTHEVAIGMDWDKWEYIYGELTYTGMPIATPDMSLIAIWNDCPWDPMAVAEGVVFDMSATGGISSITVSDSNLSVDENGNINVPAGFESVQVYNISGACVKSVAAPAGKIELNLANGVFVVKGIRNDGSVSIIKISK